MLYCCSFEFKIGVSAHPHRRPPCRPLPPIACHDSTCPSSHLLAGLGLAKLVYANSRSTTVGGCCSYHDLGVMSVLDPRTLWRRPTFFLFHDVCGQACFALKPASSSVFITRGRVKPFCVIECVEMEGFKRKTCFGGQFLWASRWAQMGAFLVCPNFVSSQ